MKRSAGAGKTEASAPMVVRSLTVCRKTSRAPTAKTADTAPSKISLSLENSRHVMLPTSSSNLLILPLVLFVNSASATLSPIVPMSASAVGRKVKPVGRGLLLNHSLFEKYSVSMYLSDGGRTPSVTSHCMEAYAA